MVTDLTYEDVKHLEGKGECSKLDLLAEIVGVAQLYYQQKNSENKKRKDHIYLPCLETQFLQWHKFAKKRKTHKANSSSSSDPPPTETPRIEKLEKPTVDKDNKTSSGLKVKFKLNGCSVVHPQDPNKNHEKAIETSASQILVDGQPRVDTNQGLLHDKIPEHLNKQIDELGNGRGVSEHILVLEKKLFKSDICPRQNRLLLPKSTTKEFLKDSEKKGIFPMAVPIIEPNYRKSTRDNVALTLWDKVTVLNDSWNRIVKRNGIHTGSTVQLWAVRYDDGQLIFVLVDLTGQLAVEGCSGGC